MELSSDLVPEGDLPGVPAGDPRGEQSLHVAQEDHAVDPVVLTAGLLMETEIGGEEALRVCVTRICHVCTNTI